MRSLWKQVSVACLVLALAGCDLKVQGSTEEEKSPAEQNMEEILRAEVRIPVEAAAPHRSNVYEFFETTARIVAERRVDVIAEGVGECMSVSVEEGDKVKKGEVLAELDKEELRAQMHQTRVTIAQQQTEYNRAKEGAAAGITRPVDVENAKLALDQSQANLNLQEVQLKNLTIQAPISGIITKRNIQPGMMVTSGTPAFTIVDPTSYILPVYIPERQLSKLHTGQQAQVRLDSAGGEVLNARVERINPSVDPATGTVKVILAFGAETQDLLREAAFSRVKLVMEQRENVLVVPKDSLIEENTRDYLMLVEEKPAEEGEGTVLVANKIEVETGLEDSDTIEVRSGITEDSLVVTLGQHTLKSGSEVTVTNVQDAITRNEDMSIEEGLALAEARKKLKKEEEEAAKEKDGDGAETDSGGAS